VAYVLHEQGIRIAAMISGRNRAETATTELTSTAPR
jgi:hypothetical protein